MNILKSILKKHVQNKRTIAIQTALEQTRETKRFGGGGGLSSPGCEGAGGIFNHRRQSASRDAVHG